MGEEAPHGEDDKTAGRQHQSQGAGDKQQQSARSIKSEDVIDVSRSQPEVEQEHQQCICVASLSRVKAKRIRIESAVAKAIYARFEGHARDDLGLRSYKNKNPAVVSKIGSRPMLEPEKKAIGCYVMLKATLSPTFLHKKQQNDRAFLPR